MTVLSGKMLQYFGPQMLVASRIMAEHLHCVLWKRIKKEMRSWQVQEMALTTGGSSGWEERQLTFSAARECRVLYLLHLLKDGPPITVLRIRRHHPAV